MVWSIALPGATYIVQTVSSLPGGSNWVDYVQLPTTNAVNTNQLVDFNPPAGMAFIPAGVFGMGFPSNLVNLPAYYMDVSLASYSLWQSVYNVSYWVGAGAGLAFPQSLLAGDRNLGSIGASTNFPAPDANYGFSGTVATNNPGGADGADVVLCTNGTCFADVGNLGNSGLAGNLKYETPRR